MIPDWNDESFLNFISTWNENKWELDFYTIYKLHKIIDDIFIRE